MSIQENQISDKIDGGILEFNRIVETADKFLKENNFDKQQTDYQLFLMQRTFPDDKYFYQKCRDLIMKSES